MKVSILNFFLITLLFSFGFIITACNSGKKKNSPVAFNKIKQQELNNYLNDYQRIFRLPGIAVVVIKDSAVYYYTSGKSNIKNNVAFTERTLFFTGSLSEVMVANGVLRLAEMGKINLDDNVVKYLTYFKMGGHSYKDVTIKNLLTQTSGVPFHNATYDLPNFNSNALEITTKSISTQLPLFKTPGSQVKRSPYNFDILADLIEKVSGKTFENFMQQEVFKPINMEDSKYNVEKIQKLNYAVPYQIANYLNFAVDTLAFYPKNREFAGSIGWHTTVKDLSKWMYSMIHNTSKENRFYLENQEKDFFKVYYKTGPKTAVGLGWEISGENFYKRNTLGGFTSFLNLMPEKNTGIAIISNVSTDIDFQQLKYSLLQWAAGNQLPKLKTPVFLPLGDKLAQTNNIQTVFITYRDLKDSKTDSIDTSLEALSPLGFNLLYHVKQKDLGILFFDFCTREFPNSNTAKLHLAEALIIDKEFGKAKRIVDQIKTKHSAEINAAQLNYIEDLLSVSQPKANIN